LSGGDGWKKESSVLNAQGGGNLRSLGTRKSRLRSEKTEFLKTWGTNEIFKQGRKGGIDKLAGDLKVTQSDEEKTGSGGGGNPF